MKVDTDRNIAMVSNRQGEVHIFDVKQVTFLKFLKLKILNTNQTPPSMMQVIKCKNKSHIKGLDFDMDSGNIFISTFEKKTLYHYQMQGENLTAVCIFLISQKFNLMY